KPAEKPADKPAEGNKPAASDLDNAREVAKVDLKNIKNLNDKQREVVHKYIDAAGSADLIRYAVGAARALAENAFPTAFLEYDKETVKNALPQASADEKAKLNKLAEDLIALADDSVRISNDIVVKADGTIFFNGVQITELAVPTNKPANLQVGGFKWGDEVKAQLDDKDYGSVPVYGDLAFLLSLTTRDLTPGDHKLVLSTGSKKTTLTLKVGATPTPVAPKTPENKPETKNPENTPNDKAEKNEKKDDKKLAKTGADSSALLVAAGILTAAGAASLLVARRRKA
ncbi:MAG: LPXTG cell wall anchor domain-containing protein, partial [Microbacteriaceae bacterium]|nr:LPXTG cell wall anchor domain-containing protein [Microbacteriaceae bacterium]